MSATPKIPVVLTPQALRANRRDRNRGGAIDQGLRPCTTGRNQIVHARTDAASSQSDGVAIQRTSLTWHYAPDETFNPRLEYVNSAWWNNLATQYPLQQIHASIHVPGFTYPIQVTFAGQTTPPTLARMGFILSDPAAVRIPAGTWFSVRTHVVVTSGHKWPVSRLASTDGSRVEGYTVNDDTLTLSPTWTTTAGVALFGPAAIFGEVPNPAKPSVLIYGDSTFQGTGDSTVELPLDRGWPCKVLNNQYASINASLHGDSVLNLVPRAADRDKVLGSCDYTLWGLMGNDIYVNGSSLAAIQAGLIAEWRRCSTGGSRVVPATITPRATSSDSYATLDGQSIVSGDTTRVALNDWIRDGCPMDTSHNALATGASGSGVIRIGNVGHPVFGYAEVADLVESSRNSGKWKIAGTLGGVPTTDGTHQAPAAIAAIKAGLNPATLFPPITTL